MNITKHDTIYLQVSDEETGEEYYDPDDTTWCSTRIGGQDVKYIRADLVEQQLAAAHDLLRQARESIEWIRHRSESQRVWGGQDWKYQFPHKQIFDRATEAMEAIDKGLA